MGVNRTKKINRYRNTERRRQISRENSPVPGKVPSAPHKGSHKRRNHRNQVCRRAEQRAQAWATIAMSTHDIVCVQGRYVETRRCRVKMPFADPTGESGTGPSRQAVHEEILHVVHHVQDRIADSVGRTQILYDDTPLPIADIGTVKANKGRTTVRFSGKSILASAREFAALKPREWGTAPRSRVVILTPMPTTQSPSAALDPTSTLARNTSYRATLTSALGQLFLSTVQDPSSGMLYAPDVLGIRRDQGDTLYQSEPDFDPYLHGERLSDDEPLAADTRLGALVAPYAVNVLAFPVSTTADSSSPLSLSLSRALEVCAGTGNRAVVFDGSKTDVREAAELLTCSGAKFKNVFDTVVFAGLSDASRRKFREAFELRVLEDELDIALEESGESEEEDEEEDMEEVVVV